MSQHQISLPDLVIASGQTDSNVLKSEDRNATTGIASGDGFRDADSISIHAPDTLPEAITVHVDNAESAVNFNPLQRPAGTDVTIVAGKTITISDIAFKALKLVAGAAVGAARTFKVTKVVWV